MNWKRIIAGVVIVAVLAGGGYFAYQQFLAPVPPEETESLDADDIAVDTGVDAVSAEGQIVPLESAQLSFQSGGELVTILVAEGDTVEAGEPLLRLDSRDQELAVQQANTAVQQATANLVAAQAGLDAAQAGLDAAAAEVSAAEAGLALIQAGPTEEQIALQGSLLDTAEAGIEQAAGSRDVTLEASSQAAIDAAEAQLAAAEAALFTAQRQYGPILEDEDAETGDKIEAQLEIDAAQVKVDAAQARIDELQSGATASERQTALSGVAAAAAQRDASQSQFDLLLLGARAEEIAVAEAQLAQAENGRAEAELQLLQAETAVAQAEAAVTEAETSAAAAQSALEKTVLTAPFAGTVANIPVKVGEFIVPGVPVLTLADMGGWLVETTDLSELNVVAIARGYPVNVTVDAFPGEEIGGVITEVGDTSELVRGDVTYVVTIALDEEDARDLSLRWGMTAFVTVDTDQQ